MPLTVAVPAIVAIHALGCLLYWAFSLPGAQ